MAVAKQRKTITIMSHKLFNVFAASIVVMLAVSFMSCEKEDPNGISKKEAKVTDFLNLYGKTANEVNAALTNFIVEKDNYNSDGNLYWVVKTKKDNLTFTLDGDEVFTTATFINNVCVDVSLLYNDVISNGASLAELKKTYGEGTKMGDNWFDWNLPDNSMVSYFGRKLATGRKALLIYRKSASASYAPLKKMEKVLQEVGLE